MAPLFPRNLTRLSTDRPDDHHFGQLDSIIKLWDVTLNNGQNDLRRKLGARWGSVGGAVVGYDAKTRRCFIAEGTINSFEKTLVPFDPNSHVLRVHSSTIRYWATRLTADHEHKSDQSIHRSTMILDECPSQNWAWIMDFAWVKKLEAAVSASELSYDGAAFNTSLKRRRAATGVGQRVPGGLIGPDVATGGGNLKRACAMLNVSKRGFYVTDGECASQGWHVFSMRCKKATPSTPTTGAPVATGDQAFGEFGDWFVQRGTGDFLRGSSTTTAPPEKPKKCGDVKREELALRGDVNFHMGSLLVHLAVKGGFKTQGIVATGWNWIDDPSPAPPDQEMADDKNSNQPILPRTLEKGLHPLVLVPQPRYRAPTPTQPPPKTPPPVATLTYPPGGGVTGAGSSIKDGSAIGVFSATKRTGEMFSIDLANIAGRQDLYVAFDYYLSAFIGGGEQMTLNLYYKVLQPGVTAPTTWQTLTENLNVADNPASLDDIKELVFKIPNVNDGNAKGGQVILWFVRDAPDACASDFLQVGQAVPSLLSEGEPFTGFQG